MARALLVAEDQLAKGEGDAAFLKAKIVTSRFYAEHLLSKAPGMRDAIIDGSESVNAMPIDSF
jgi:3-(methylthio)propanoyl-CoA dehydrogenase